MGAEEKTNKARSAVSQSADSVGNAVDEAKESRTVRVVARSGFVALGLIHILIGSIALEVALGASGGQADESGAVAQLAATPGGVVLLWAGLIASGALALYMATNAVMGWSGGSSKPWLNRLKAAGLAVVFAVVAATFGSFALSRPSNSSEKSRSASADLMSSAPGTVFLVVIGVALLAAAGTYIFLGLTRKYEKNLTGKPPGVLGDAFTVFGVVGYCAKGVALGAVGLLILIATAAHDPSQQGGLDAALKAFLKQPFGGWVLGFVSLGLIAYGVYSLVRSRYQRL